MWRANISAVNENTYCHNRHDCPIDDFFMTLLFAFISDLVKK